MLFFNGCVMTHGFAQRKIKKRKLVNVKIVDVLCLYAICEYVNTSVLCCYLNFAQCCAM